LLNRSIKSSFLNALIFLTYPIVIMQGTTAQTDLVVASLIACAFYFLAMGFRSEKKYLALSGLAIALALGSKQTAFFILPGYLLLFIFLWAKNRGKHPGALGYFLVFFLVFFLAFGSLTYIMNYLHFGGFFGPPGAVESQSAFLTIQDKLETLRINPHRLLYNAVDPSGLPYPMKNYFVKAKAILFSNFMSYFHIELEGTTLTQNQTNFSYLTVPHLTEDEAWFGPLGFVLMSIALLAGLVNGIRKKDPLRFGLFLTTLAYTLCIIMFRPGWDPYQGRYFLSIAVLITPLINLYFSDTKFLRFFRYASVVMAVFITLTTHLLNEAKPVAVFKNNPSLIRETIWNLDRVDKMTLPNRSLRDPLRSIFSLVPEDSVLGLCIDTGVWDYPFFGEDFSQQIVPINPKEMILNQNWVSQNEIDYIVMNTNTDLWENTPPYLEIIYDYGGWILFSVK